MTNDQSRRFWNQIFRLVTPLLGLWLTWDLLSHLVAELLWFQEVGYLPAFLKRLQTQLCLWVVVYSISAGFLFANLSLANRLKYPKQSPLGAGNSGVSQKVRAGQTMPNSPVQVLRSQSVVRRQSVRVTNSKLRAGDEA